MKFRICGKWEVEVNDEYWKMYKHGPESYLKHYIKHFNDIGKQNKAFLGVLSNIKKPDRIRSVVELFGGTGLWTVILQEKLQPRHHLVYDWDQKCVNLINEIFRGHKNVTAFQADSYGVLGNGVRADLVVLDYQRFTILHYANRRELGPTLENKPKYLTITDSAVNKMHLNKGRYSEFFGRTVENNEDYVEAFSEWFHREYGYAVVSARYHFGATVMLLRPVKDGKRPRPKIKRIKSHEGGFEILEGGEILEQIRAGKFEAKPNRSKVRRVR